MPDGRTQTVYYTSDGVRGYEADVKYTGYHAKEDAYYKPAVYPSYKPVYSTTTYKPAPVYKQTYRPKNYYPAWYFNINKKY